MSSNKITSTNESFLHFFTENTVMVFNIHSKYPKGTSCSDILAMSRLIAKLNGMYTGAIDEIDIRPYSALTDSDKQKNMVLIGGPKVNPFCENLFTREKLLLYMRSGYIWDSEKEWAIVPEYSSDCKKVRRDFGLIVLIPRPIAKIHRLILAGLKGTATRASSQLLTTNKIFARLQELLSTGVGLTHYTGSELVQVLFQVTVEADGVYAETIKILKLTKTTLDEEERPTAWQRWEDKSYREENLPLAIPLFIQFHPKEWPRGEIFFKEKPLHIEGCFYWKHILHFLARARVDDFEEGGANQGYRSQTEIIKYLNLGQKTEIRKYINRINKATKLIESGARGTGTYRLSTQPLSIDFAQS